MMEFNFDELTQRCGTGSYKWDSDTDRDVLQLWVADMDFRTAPAVREAVMNRAESGIYGYVRVPESYYMALHDWFAEHHGWNIDPNRVIYTSGVVPAISAIIKALVAPGEKVILQTPAYNCFFSSVRNNHVEMADNPLLRVDLPDGDFSYRIDFDGLERVASEPDVKLMILCNPHNPTGRVWTREELERISSICNRHGVRVVSDEIHCELTRCGIEYIPYAAIDRSAIVCCSPSKAFNTAGLQIANIVCPDDETQQKIDRAINDNEVCDVNPFGVVGLEAAYRKGAEWLEALRKYLDGNFEYLRQQISAKAPLLKVCASESTYLAWIDIRGLDLTSDAVERLLLEKGKVRISSGSIYHGEGYIRLNYACPRARLAEALDRIFKVLSQTKKD